MLMYSVHLVCVSKLTERIMLSSQIAEISLWVTLDKILCSAVLNLVL